MRARNLVEAVEPIDADAPAVDALRTLARGTLPGLVVRSGAGFTIVPASQVLRVVLPRYVLDDGSLGRVWDEASADVVAERLRGRTAGDIVAALSRPDNEVEPVVDADATLVEITTVLARARVPLVAVVDEGRFLGVVTVHRVIERLLG